MSFSAYDAGSLTVTFKATLDGSDLVPHKNIDKINGKAPNFGAGAAGTDTLRVVLASDSPGVGGGGGDATAANQATIIGHVDGIETALTTANGKLDTLARQPTGVKRLTSAGASTNADFAKASAGTLFQVVGYNAAASVRYLKLYNKASAPTVGSDTPVLTIPLPPAAAFAIDIPPLPFATGIAFALTTGVADADTGALTSGDVVGLNILYA